MTKEGTEAFPWAIMDRPGILLSATWRKKKKKKKTRFIRGSRSPAGRGSSFFKNSRIESGRVGSGQEVFQSHGTGQITLFRSDPRDVIRLVKRHDHFFFLKTREEVISHLPPSKVAGRAPTDCPYDYLKRVYSAVYCDISLCSEMQASYV